ncbi:MAG: hypothetical protein F4W92_08725 [Gammaproteobacteria bacterium]|nr:hypothetical protein [Gammaproteobacteria bacterium]
MSDTSCSLFSKSQIPHQTDIAEELIRLDQIQSLPYAIRESKQEDYERLYLSIKEEGLQQPFVVAQPPDSEHYTLIAGGNTRLEIIQRIHEESRGSRFHEIHCVVVSWPGICIAKISHLVTNDLVNEARFFERAEAILKFIDGNSDLPIDHTTSDREVSKFFTEHGFPLYRSTYAAMRYAVDFLNSHLPLSLACSFCTLDVKHIQRLENRLKTDWVAEGKTETEFNQLFIEVAQSCDHEDLNYETFRDLLTEQVIAELQDIEDSSVNTVSKETPIKENSTTKNVPREKDTIPESDTTSTYVSTKDDTCSASEFLNKCIDQEPCEQIRNLAMEIARRFDFQECIALGELGEFGFYVVDLPPEESSLTTRLVWEYLVNFSGTCEMSKDELIPHLNSQSKLYKEFQSQETSLSLQTAKEIDLSAMWRVDSEAFELLLQLWRLVFEHTEFRPDLGDAEPPIGFDEGFRIAA